MRKSGREVFRVACAALISAAIVFCNAARSEASEAGETADAGVPDEGAAVSGGGATDGAATENAGAVEDAIGIAVAKSARGSLSIGAFAQAGYEYLPDESPGERNSFALHHAALVVGGTLEAAHLDLVVAGDAAAGLVPGARRTGPGGEMRSAEDVPFVTDAAISWRIPAIGAAVTIGRFVPGWGLTMPERPTRLGSVSYPLYVYGNAASLGRFRNVGLEASAEVIDRLTVIGGVFNGGANSFADADDYKDILVGLSVRPVRGLEIRAASFFAFERSDLRLADLAAGQRAPTGAERHIQPIAEARYRDHGLDLLLGGALDAVHRADRDPRDDLIAFGATGRAGILIVGDWFQLTAQLDYFDPDAGSGGDDQLRVTAGPQFLLDGEHGQIRVIYAFDRFGGRRAMCETYLEEVGCGAPLPGAEAGDLPSEAKRDASTVIVQFGVDL
jgi:hypothetical protein